MQTQSVRAAQTPLRALYATTPEAAMVTDSAVTGGMAAADPFHSSVESMVGSGATLAVGVHEAIGGPHDAPTPGDILCSALAACLESSIRMIANLLCIELEHLRVSACADVDVRGTLMIDRNVPVGFQSIGLYVELRARQGTSEALLAKLRAAAESSCVVLQTLRYPPPVSVHFGRCAIEQSDTATNSTSPVS